MSALGSRSARSGRLYSCWMLLFGVIVCFAGWNGYRPFSSPVGILICVFGTAACILSFFFRAGEGKEDKSVGSRIHGIASAVGFIALLPADILSAVVFPAPEEPRITASSPFSTENEAPSSALIEVSPVLYSFVTLLNSIYAIKGRLSSQTLFFISMQIPFSMPNVLPALPFINQQILRTC